MSVKKLIELNNFDLTLPGGKVLQKNLSFNMNEGELFLLSGENGSGKTTLIKKILKSTPHLQVSYLPQLMNLNFPFPITLEEVIHLNEKGRKVQDFSQKLLKPTQFSLNWNTASGGEKKKTLLLRAFLDDPELLILDEPFNHLDKKSIQEILDFLVRSLEEKVIKGALLVSHIKEFKERHMKVPKREMNL